MHYFLSNQFPIGVPETPSGIEIKILKKLFTEEEANITTLLTINPEPASRIARRHKFNKIKLESKPVGWAVSFEFAIKAQLAGWKLGEVPLISLNRLYGEGKPSFRVNWFKEYSKWFLWGSKKLFFSGKMRSKVKVKIPEKIKSRRNR